MQDFCVFPFRGIWVQYKSDLIVRENQRKKIWVLGAAAVCPAPFTTVVLLLPHPVHYSCGFLLSQKMLQIQCLWVHCTLYLHNISSNYTPCSRVGSGNFPAGKFPGNYYIFPVNFPEFFSNFPIFPGVYFDRFCHDFFTKF